MTFAWVAVGIALASWVMAFWLSMEFRRTERQHARERDLLVNQIMHLTGKTWTPPPAAPPFEEPVEDGRYVTSPEQLPDL